MTKIFSSKEYLSEDLLQAGLHHLEAAEYLLKGSPELFDSAGYLAHIGIELMIKAWILHKTSKFPGIHSLSDLIDKLKELDSSLSFIKKEEETIAYLSKFEKLRYPNRTSPTEIGSEDIDQINMIADTLWQKMPDNLIDEYQKLPSNKKGGRVFMERPVHIPRDLEFETGITL